MNDRERSVGNQRAASAHSCNAQPPVLAGAPRAGASGWAFNESRPCRRPRQASVLLVVLVVIVLLALGAYTFSETMISEYQAVAMHGRKVESRVLADSGVQYVAAMLQQRFDFASEDVFDNPVQLQDVLLTKSDVARGRGRFSVVAPRMSSESSQSIRFGLTDESGKLNLNTLAERVLVDQLNEEESRAILLQLPGMTVETADATLDWLDPDDMPRQYGAETEYYSRLSPAYVAKNGPLDSLDELLQVRGITPDLLNGKDANRNGLVDPHENDVLYRASNDGGADAQERGWRPWLTVHSRESKVRRDGRRKINVNQPSVDNLFEEVSLEFGDDLAEFVVAFRKQKRASASAVGPDETGRIESIYDLIGSAFAADGDSPAWESPWTIDPSDMRTYLPNVLDALTTHHGSSREGRININLAPREVLLGVPGIDESLADVIIAAQPWRSSGAPVDTKVNPRATTAWLLIEGHVDVAKMRRLDRYIAARGDVYSGQIIGYFDAGETVTRLEVVIDATYEVPRVVSLQDLTDLGPGVSRRQLKPNRMGVFRPGS